VAYEVKNKRKKLRCLLHKPLLPGCEHQRPTDLNMMDYFLLFMTAVPIIMIKLFVWGRGIAEDMCYEIRRAEAFVD
jgi:hypothetical protein